MTVSLTTRLRTVHALGLRNVAAVLWYRVSLRLPLSGPRRVPVPAPVAGPFFRAVSRSDVGPAPEAWRHAGTIFGSWPVQWQTGRCPDWLVNPLTGTTWPLVPWWQLSDANSALGDIKGVWDVSRFDWVLSWAQRGTAGDATSWATLEVWLADWLRANPPYLGPNWKCAQEASLRVLHLAMAATLSGQARQPLPGLLDLVAAHLRRIAPTLGYSRAQDNNHGTSEAAALFVGGSWLVSAGRPDGRVWAEQGRRALEERVGALVDADGTFSQYSVNYHRLFLDTLSMAEVWRRTLALDPWSPRWRARAVAATEWLWRLVDPVTGDAPNVGANDGARLLTLTETDFRDFRPSVYLAGVLFLDRPCFPGPGPWQTPLAWLGVPAPTGAWRAPDSRVCDGGGFAVLRRDGTLAVLRFPRYRFRPSQEDALHLDVWRDGDNLFRDAGTFSYLAPVDELNLFAGVAGHSTLQVDDRPQMPRLGRFLLGDWWPDAQVITWAPEAVPARLVVTARDGHGLSHTRAVDLHDGAIIVRDTIAGEVRDVRLRWRLRPGPWRLDGLTVTDGEHHIRVSGAGCTLTLETGQESRYYQRRSPAPVLVVRHTGPGEVTTTYQWAP